MADMISDSSDLPNIFQVNAMPETQEHRDVLERTPNLFRLLYLLDEHGSGGIVEKVVIDQLSLHRFLNLVRPGSYDPVSEINFTALDNLSIKPTGLYGDRSEIVSFLQEAQYLDASSVALISQATPGSSEDSTSVLRPGLYLALHSDHATQGSSKCAYIIYWPEDTTWDDQAASSSVQHNRVAFMHHMTKLTDQTVALVSPSQARAFVWETGARETLPEGQQDNNDDVGLFSFEVERSLEQEEDAIASFSFTVPAEFRHPAEGGNNIRTDLVPGEQQVALVSVAEKVQTKREQVKGQSISPLALQQMIESTEEPLQLGDLSPESLEILATNGLREKFQALFDGYEEKTPELKRVREKSETEDKRFIDQKINVDKPKVKMEVQNIIRRTFGAIFPSLNIGLDAFNEPETSAELHNEYAGLRELADGIQEQHKWAVIRDKTFRSLKPKWLAIQGHLMMNPWISEQAQRVIIDRVHESALGTSTGGQSTGLWLGDLNSFNWTPRQQPISDPDFIAWLQQVEMRYPLLSEITSEIHDCLRRELGSIENKLLEAQVEKILSVGHQSMYRAARDARELAFRNGKQTAFASLMGALKQSTASDSSRVVCIDSIRRIHHGRYGYPSSTPQFRWSGTRTVSITAQTRYRVFPLELAEQDSQLCQTGEAYTPRLKLEIKHGFEFTTVGDRSVEFLQLVHDKCLVAVSEPGQIRIYIEENALLDQSIMEANAKITLSRDPLGSSRCLFAFDQATRLLAIVHGQKDAMISIHIFDESYANLHLRGSSIPINRLYNQPVELTKFYFIPGTEDMCLIEKSGRVRILSLVTQRFRNVHLQTSCPIINVFPAPDGSCLFVATRNGASSSSPDRLVAFCWGCFGPSYRGVDSIELPPSNAYRVATRFEGRGQTHVISFDADSGIINSTIIQAKQKTNESSSRRSNRSGSKKAVTETYNNSLIDCHLEVCERFLVMPALFWDTFSPTRRHARKITFVSPIALPELKDYFARMTAMLGQAARDLVGDRPSSDVISRTDKRWDNANDKISEFRIGSFMVELLCLVPLQLAITRESGFTLLKDGIYDPAYEQALLIMKPPIIIGALSLGWYGMLFQSYMTNKPVHVISSTGERRAERSNRSNQSADKHFAGSAMRTGEGVWLSCTPTEDCLLVSLNFEGIHSIERSAQAAALLMLFNVVISDLRSCSSGASINNRPGEIMELVKLITGNTSRPVSSQGDRSNSSNGNRGVVREESGGTLDTQNFGRFITDQPNETSLTPGPGSLPEPTFDETAPSTLDQDLSPLPNHRLESTTKAHVVRGATPDMPALDLGQAAKLAAAPSFDGEVSALAEEVEQLYSELECMKSKRDEVKSERDQFRMERDTARGEGERYRMERDEARSNYEKYREERDMAIEKSEADAEACRELRRKVMELNKVVKEKDESSRKVIQLMVASLQGGSAPMG